MSFRIGPPSAPPKRFSVNGCGCSSRSARPLTAPMPMSARVWNACCDFFSMLSRALSREFCRNSKSDSWNSLVPSFVCALICPHYSRSNDATKLLVMT